ncbi:DNA cytosine methyltransferase [Haloferax sp. Atlit-12N]|uniref:DNA cytosine methyltransferase n=1 Tax=Haloferax sp. Atlit-12N TaxID=2077203 RepID=UPI000E261752|nr:DNA cytosine methyltransferase [Haloferax sp. Atlit-12N]RDZ65990.1 DNA cytosine methyltransferase [Haloferax sp. Atlit-12N]
MSDSTHEDRSSGPVTAVDLFCGAGGLSTGLALACEELDREVELTAVNHWSKAIESHKQNHPWATHLNAKVEELHPPDVAPGDGPVDLLIAAPECTHFSIARGGKPVNEQSRASPWHVVDWLEKLDVQNFLVENVPELKSWGPVDDNGSPSRNGDIFEAWVNTLHALGYSVDWRVLNAADYGDATSRRRLFVVGRKGKRAEFPAPTHSENGVDGTDEWRPASEVIDWSDRGESIWERSRPLVNNTMQRIAEGIRRHCHDDLAPFADVIDDLEKSEVSAMQADIVDAGDVPAVVEQRCEPFLVKYYGTSTAKPVSEPMDTITANGGKYALCTPYVLGQHGGSVARDVDERPLPTIATRGAIGLYQPEAFVLPRNMVHGGLHSNGTYTPEERPLHTVTANNHDGHVVTPYLIEYYGNGRAQSLDDPLPTVTTKGRFALVVPELYPLGLDIRFRMLQPRELAAAMGFPEEYELVGNKTETTKQIGNAVPVNLAKNLVNQLLTGDAPSLHTFAQEQGVEADD